MGSINRDKEITMTIKLDGRVVSDGQPVPGAMVRLVGGEEALGADPQAVANSRSAVTWTRAISGFSGSLWNCWQKFVAREVSGISWAEFRVEAGRYDPALPETDYRLDAGRTYFLPENSPPRIDMRSTSLDVVWDRTLTGFAGNRWACWQQYVRGKVVGLSWEQFREALVLQNPSLTAHGGQFQVDQQYRLPRNSGQTEYVRIEVSNSTGQFAFDALRPNRYRLEVTAEGYERLVQPIEVDVDRSIEVPLAPFVVVVDRGDFVRPSGRQFSIGGQSFAFIGVNLRGLVHYGQSQMPLADAKGQLGVARDMGVRVVRVFLPHSEVSFDETKNRLGKLIEMMKAKFRDMYLIVALTNLYGDVPFHVPGDDDKTAYTFRQADWPSQWPHILNVEWFRETYKLRYQPFAEMIADFFRNEPTIMAYDIGNELKAHEAPDLFIEFNHAMARRIKELAPRQLVTTGMISTRHAHMAGSEDQRRRLYALPQLDFITVHAYHDLGNDKPSPNDDSDLSRYLNKPYVVEEAGFMADIHLDRAPLVRQEMDQLFGLGASGYMPWGFMAGHDNNDGDHGLGMDTRWHSDWDSLFRAYRERADHLKDTSVEVTAPTTAFSAGMQVFTCTVVNLRRSAGLAGSMVCPLPGRTRLVVTGASVQHDDLTWWPVNATLADGSTAQGWAAQTAPTGEVLLSNI